MPDGNNIFFVRYGCATGFNLPHALMSVNTSTGVGTVYNSDYYYLHASVSADGKWAVADIQPTFVSGSGINALYNTSLIIVNLSTGKSTNLGTINVWLNHPGHSHPVFSPDGSHILFTFANAGNNGNLWVGYMDVSDITGE